MSAYIHIFLNYGTSTQINIKKFTYGYAIYYSIVSIQVYVLNAEKEETLFWAELIIFHK